MAVSSAQDTLLDLDDLIDFLDVLDEIDIRQPSNRAGPNSMLPCSGGRTQALNWLWTDRNRAAQAAMS